MRHGFLATLWTVMTAIACVFAAKGTAQDDVGSIVDRQVVPVATTPSASSLKQTSDWFTYASSSSAQDFDFVSRNGLPIVAYTKDGSHAYSESVLKRFSAVILETDGRFTTLEIFKDGEAAGIGVILELLNDSALGVTVYDDENRILSEGVIESGVAFAQLVVPGETKSWWGCMVDNAPIAIEVGGVVGGGVGGMMGGVGAGPGIITGATIAAVVTAIWCLF